jgi:hypothetical protein
MRLLDVTLRLSYEQRVILHDAALHLAIQFEKQGKGFPENLQAILTRLDEAGALFVNHNRRARRAGFRAIQQLKVLGAQLERTTGDGETSPI